MGASNFARGNTSKVFAVLMDTEEKYSKCTECDEKHFEYEENYVEEGDKNCPDCDCTDCIEHDTEYRGCEDFEYSDFKYHLREVAERKAKDTIFSYDDAEGSDNDRNYCASDLFTLTTSKSYGDITVELRITGQIVSAYYEGASLDFRLEIYNGGEWSEVEDGYYTVTVEDILEGLFDVKYNDTYNSDMNKGLRTILFPKAVRWAEREAEKMIQLVEDIFTEVSMPLNVVATFSNGETVYSKV
jgi:hypothetical protein